MAECGGEGVRSGGTPRVPSEGENLWVSEASTMMPGIYRPVPRFQQGSASSPVRRRAPVSASSI